MISSFDLDVFQYCRAKWKLAKAANEIPSPADIIQDDYTYSIRKTIFQMYSWLQEKGKLITDKQVRSRWDKNWYQKALDSGKYAGDELLRKTANGWKTLEKYWGDIYIQEATLEPIVINMEFNFYLHNILFRPHIDILLASPKEGIIVRSIGGPTTAQILHNSLASKLLIVALEKTLNRSVDLLSHVNILLPPGTCALRQVNIDRTYRKRALAAIQDVSISIKNDAIYGIMPWDSRQCDSCKYKRKCWY
ncbi:MAG: hypothetical protein DRN26_00280 [Thermoplasmata archaeon]|nr:MAG: hypothetical protein DRN26_00280 [Thermoplasmata archaeon]